MHEASITLHFQGGNGENLLDRQAPAGLILAREHPMQARKAGT